MHHPAVRTTHTTAFGAPVMEREIAQGSTMRDRSEVTDRRAIRHLSTFLRREAKRRPFGKDYRYCKVNQGR